MSTTFYPTREGVVDTNARRAAVSGFVGSSLEYYDFFIYASAAALIFGKVFFPDAGGASTLLSVSTLGVAYVARPLGAVIWGHLGDRLGRRDVLVATILLMGIATFLIGCLPTYDQIGIAAPILLVVLRLFQGISAGGESPGSGLLSLEHAPDGKRAFLASFTISGLMFGIVLATVVFIPVAALPDEALLSWGWRIPFLVSILMTFVAYTLRRKVVEPEVFNELKKQNQTANAPVVELLRDHWSTVLRVAVCSTFTMVLTTVNVFGLSYGTEVAGVSKATMLTVIALASFVAVLTQPFYAILADRIGRKPVFVTGMLGCAVMTFAFFGAIATQSSALIFLAGIVLIGVCYAMPNAVYLAYFPEQFPARVRYSGTAISLMVGLVAAGFTPALAQVLTSGDTANWMPVAWLVCGFAVLSSAAAILLPETHHIPTAQLGEGPVHRESVTS